MSTYSPILRTELIADGAQSGTWGNTTNQNYQYVFEQAIAGYQAITITPIANKQVLTYTDGPTATPSLNQSIYAMLKLNTGTLSANFSLYAPPVSKTYIIWNNTSYTATVYNSVTLGSTTAGGTGIDIPAGLTSFIWTDGTNFYSVITGSSGDLNVSGNLTVGGDATITGDIIGNADTATSATRITNAGGWNITPVSTKLVFSYNGLTVGSLDSSGNFIVIGNVTAYGTP